MISLMHDVETNPGPPNKISIISCNMRGLKSHLKCKLLFRKIINMQKNNPFVFFLQETHFTGKESRILDCMLRLNRVDSYGPNRQRGTTIIFNKENWSEIIQIYNCDEGRICYLVCRNENETFVFLNIYAPNDHNQVFFLELLELIKSVTHKYQDVVLILGGDFNLVLNSTVDSSNRVQTVKETEAIDVLKQIIAENNLSDAIQKNTTEQIYTWSARNIASRLDMFFVNKFIVPRCQYSVNNTFTNTDHTAIVVEITIPSLTRIGPGIVYAITDSLEDVKILNEITKEIELFKTSIPQDWSPLLKWDYLKTQVRVILNKRKKTNIHNLENEINYIEVELNNLMTKRQTSELEKINIMCLKQELDNKRLKFSKILALASRANFYEKGEKNNKYFLNQLKERRKKMQIDVLKENDKLLTNQDEIKSSIYNFYKDLYSKQNNLEPNLQMESLPQVSEDDNVELSRPIEPVEIENTIKNLKATSPGPDGLNYTVYKKLWNTLRPYMCQSWEHSLINGELSNLQRKSTITLLEKKGKDKSLIKNLRPISLTNCDLKIYTRILANRLNKVLDKLIHPSQKAYIRGRLVHDNLRYIDLWRHYFVNKRLDALIVLLDARKAFDSVDHTYMFHTLKAFGFSQTFINIIKMLYNNLESNVLVNGFTTKYFMLEQRVKR